MGLSGLDTALSGLRVAQQQLNTISANVSNVNTPGYTRKILPQETVVIAQTAVGVRTNPVIRKVDLNLERDFWTQISNVSYLDTQTVYLNTIQKFHGPPELEISVAAEIAELRDKFSTLADSPEDVFLQRATVDQAAVVAKKFNDFAAMITEMRNDAQDDMAVSIEKINGLLGEIAELNKQIKLNTVTSKTVAALQDSRDEAVRKLSEEIEISFFIRGDGVMVVQTAQGVELAGDRAETVFFESGPQGPLTYYPASAGGIFVGGDPDDNPNAIEITETGIGGRLGSLLDLRDDVLPRQQALADELAHKLALRFAAQGLALFTDASGVIPADTAPDPNTLPNPTPVTYVGFSSTIRVNANIVADNTLVQQGTASTDLPVPAGSNEVIQRILEYTFGQTEYQEAAGAIDLRASGGPATLQQWLGIFSQNSVTGTLDLTDYADCNAIIAAGGEVFDPNPPGPPLNDTFRLTFEEARTGLSVPPLLAGDLDFDISLSVAQLQAGANAAEQIAAEINTQVAARVILIPQMADLDIVASVNSYGQLVIESRGNITIDASFAGGMDEEGLEFLGLTEGTTVTTDPWIEVQVGNDPPTRVTIEPDEDETDFISKLDHIGGVDPDGGVPGLAVDFDALTGLLTIRPGDNSATPGFGGGLKITGGSFQADGSGLGGIPANATMIEALFGAAQPVTDVLYASPTAVVGQTVAFRSDNLGADASLSTGIISSTTLIDYAQKFVNRQAEEINAIDRQITDETAFRDLLQRRLLDESAVNLDEELANLIVIQTAFAASARVITAIDEEFQELLNAI